MQKHSTLFGTHEKTSYVSPTLAEVDIHFDISSTHIMSSSTIKNMNELAIIEHMTLF